MASGNAVLVNFSAGETSPKSRGRFDAPWYATAARKLLNFIAEFSGPARYRPGFVYLRQTRTGAVPRMLPFHIDDNLAYMLEFTPGFMRVYLASTEDLLTTTVATITGISEATQGVVTVASATGLSNGQEVILAGIVGMAQMNERQVIIDSLAGNTFKMKDPVTGAYISTSALTTYVSGGTASVVYEITTPFQSSDLPNLQIASTRSTSYITSTTQPAQKLTVDANNDFTLGTYTRVNDPFSSTATLNVLGISSCAITDDFENGLAAWTASLMGTALLLGSHRAYSLDTARNAPGYCSASIFAAQTAVTGEWDFDLANTGSGVVVSDTLGTGSSGVASAFARFFPIWKDANNYYELRVYGTDCNTVALYFNNATSISKIATFNGFAVPNSTTHFKLTRNGSGVFTLYQDGVNIGTVTENTLGVSNQGYFYLPATYQTSVGLGNIVQNQIGLDNVVFPNSTLKTIVYFPAGVIPASGVQYTFSGVVGATQINGNTYLLVSDGNSNVAYLKTLAGADVNSSAWGAYVSGGIAVSAPENPIGVAFYEGRLVFAGTNQRPDCIFLSRSPDSNGNSRYDDFTGGSDADFACFFQLAPTGGSTDYISWARGGPDYLFVGTFGGPYRVSGSGLDIPITPDSINVRQFDTAGCEATMAAGLAEMFFVNRGGTTVRSIKVINPYLATFESADLCLNAEQIPAESPIQRVVLAQGRPTVLWAYRADGVLVGMSVHITAQNSDAITGWHRHQLGGGGKVLDIAIIQRATSIDQLWAATERIVNGVTRCFVEVMADEVVFPDKEDFFGAGANKAADLAAFYGALYRAQENYIHMDAAATYDGTARGTAAGATLTPAAVSGTSVVFTASAAVFTAADVGLELWKKPDPITGLGSGRAVITGYTDSQHVTCDIDDEGVAFDSAAAIAAGSWYIAATTISGLSQLEGAQVSVVTDGAVYSDGIDTTGTLFPTVTVTNGTIVLNAPAGKVHVGLPYTGLLQTHNLEMGGRTGPAQAKPRNIAQMFIRFLNTLGVQYGTDPYRMQSIEQRSVTAAMDRPAPVFSGIRKLQYSDTWQAEYEKNVVVMQRLPLPAIVEFVDVHYSTGDEGEDE